MILFDYGDDTILTIKEPTIRATLSTIPLDEIIRKYPPWLLLIEYIDIGVENIFLICLTKTQPTYLDIYIDWTNISTRINN